MSRRSRAKNTKAGETQPLLNISEGNSSDIADAGRVDVKVEPAPALRIESDEQAIAHVKENYTVPTGCKLVYVTEDANVFWKENGGSAVNHAKRNNLKLFSLTWD